MNQHLLPAVAPPTRQQRSDALEQLKNEFRQLMLHTNTPCRWTGTRTQMLEMTYLMYIEETITDTSGRPLGFNELCRTVCLRLQQKPPKNPCAYINMSRMRKTNIACPFFDTYCFYYNAEFTMQNS